MPKIVVFGITGYAGSHIADELLGRGHTVVGVSRNTASVTPREHLAVWSGSVYDSALLSEIASGADVIVVAVPALQNDEVELATAVPGLLDAAATAGARLGVVGGASSLLVATGGPRVIDAGFPLEYKAEAEAHSRVLEALRDAVTTVDWFYLSPAASFGAYNPGTKTGTFRLGTDVLITAADGSSEISGEDYATAFVDEIEKPVHHQTRFTLGY
jgi:uncharacterized protein